MRIICTPTILCLISFSIKSNFAKRGPHHPKSEIDKGRRKMDEHFAHDVEHIQEDLQHHTDSVIQHRNISEMTEDEKNFFYFKLHDSDNNDVLDGLELLRAATHHSVHIENEEQHGHDDGGKSDEANEFEHIIEIIDDFIQFADFNNDGYLNYPEYAQAIKQNIDMPINNHIDNVSTKEFK
ncbi:hypothetical protein HA402_006995 [Bradysia odoriphaga]|nr:hypothetical protein HA402_006995 [Bradysia odoriphaga]